MYLPTWVCRWYYRALTGNYILHIMSLKTNCLPLYPFAPLSSSLSFSPLSSFLCFSLSLSLQF